MCGLVDDAFSFVKDSLGEIASHPLQAAGAALGIPGYDPFFGGLFNKDALISPTGNFTTGAWNDMYNANPNDSGALGLFHSVNDVADKVAPAIAGYYGGPALAGAFGGEAGGGAAASTPAFTTGLESAGTTGALESGLGGAATYGVGAGTGTAIGSGGANALGAGTLGIAGGDALGGTVGTTFGGALGAGANAGTGLGTAALPTGGAATPLGGGAVSAEGSQAAAGTAMPGQGLGPTSFEGSGVGGGEQGAGNLSALYGANPSDAGTVSAGSPTGQVLGQSSGGISPAVTSTGSATGGGVDENTLQGLFKLFNTGANFWQQRQQAAGANNYANSIKDIFSPTGAYAQQMAQTLARQDAAAGRNSQYGERATELAAKLAQAQAGALGNSNYAQAAQNRSNSNVLNSIFSNFGNPQGIKQLQSLYSTAAPYVTQGANYLSNLF